MLTKPTKPKKTNKKETTTARGDPLCSDNSEIPEWLQEFRENLVDDEIPLQGGSHASSSHEVSLEPTTRRREDLGKHNVHTHFPKDRNCEICKRTKITRAPCRRRKGEAVPRAANFGDLITADHKVLSDNCESRNNHRYARIRESEKFKTVLELYDLEIHQKKLRPDYHRLKTMVKRSIEQEIRNKNFGARSGNFEKNAVVKNPGIKQRVQRILGDCWQWEANGQCVKGDNCSFRHDI